MYIESLAQPELRRQSSAALAVCNMVRENPESMGYSMREPAVGPIMRVKFVDGGRFLFRFFDLESVDLSFDSKQCNLHEEPSGFTPMRVPYKIDDKLWQLTGYSVVTDGSPHEFTAVFLWKPEMDEENSFPFMQACNAVLNRAPVTPFLESLAEFNRDFVRANIVLKKESGGLLGLLSSQRRSFNIIEGECANV